jgi:hypothetical protein
MELQCPSCGNVHRVEDYPGAFEIQCSCSYSILMPDQDALARHASLPAKDISFTAPPSAMEESDINSQIKLNENKPQRPSPQGVSGLTPPEKLPEGMLYDPFEVSSLPEQGAPQSLETPESFAENLEAPLDGAPAFAALDEAPAATESATPSAAKPAAKPAPAKAANSQDLVNRVQSASLGHFLGASYHLSLEGLDKIGADRVLDRCEGVLEKRPWLRHELKKRSVDLSALRSGRALENVPELLAVEIFLTCRELGGRCEFRKIL